MLEFKVKRSDTILDGVNLMDTLGNFVKLSKPQPLHL